MKSNEKKEKITKKGLKIWNDEHHRVRIVKAIRKHV
jgi:hypothetical protein